MQFNAVTTLIDTYDNIYFITSHTTPFDISSGQPWTILFDNTASDSAGTWRFKNEWADLFALHPDRFVFALDNVTGSDWSEVQYYPQITGWESALGGLEDAAAHAIAHGNAERLWRLSVPEPPALMLTAVGSLGFRLGRCRPPRRAGRRTHLRATHAAHSSLATTANHPLAVPRRVGRTVPDGRRQQGPRQIGSRIRVRSIALELGQAVGAGPAFAQPRLAAAVGQVHDEALPSLLARELGLTPTKITRLLDLVLLAPDIQEEILLLEAAGGKEPVTARALREVVRHPSWTEQRKAWRALQPA